MFGIVLFAAVRHATWNAVVKGGDDKVLTTILVAGSGAAIAILLLPFLPAPARPSWPFLAASTVLQIIYYVLIAQVYRIADTPPYLSGRRHSPRFPRRLLPSRTAPF